MHTLLLLVHMFLLWQQLYTARLVSALLAVGGLWWFVVHTLPVFGPVYFMGWWVGDSREGEGVWRGVDGPSCLCRRHCC